MGSIRKIRRRVYSFNILQCIFVMISSSLKRYTKIMERVDCNPPNGTEQIIISLLE